MSADRAFRNSQLPGDLRVRVAGGDEDHEFVLTWRESGEGMAATFGVQIGLMKMGPKQREHVPVTIAEVHSGLAEEEQS
jgi:hypothetical protein